jgi:tRNA(fMet)-specific endonuclease VapC
MPIYMLDTDICSYAMKRTNKTVAEKLRHLAVGEACISAITKAELKFGVAISPRRDRDAVVLSEFLLYTPVLDFPDEATGWYAEVRAELHRRGELIGANDLLIAAHALALGLTLVSNNTREFGRIRGLKLENWAA